MLREVSYKSTDHPSTGFYSDSEIVFYLCANSLIRLTMVYEAGIEISVAAAGHPSNEIDKESEKCLANSGTLCDNFSIVVTFFFHS